MKKTCLALLIVALFASGCGVSEKQFRAQVLKAQALNAQKEQLTAQSSAQSVRIAELTAKLTECERMFAASESEAAKLRENLEKSVSRAGSLGGQRDRLEAELDLEKKLRAQLEEEADETKNEIDGLKKRIVQLNVELEAARTETEKLFEQATRDAEAKQRELREKREKIDELSRTYEGLLENMEEEVKRGRVTISRLKGKLSVNVLDEILFDSGSAKIKEEGEQVLARVGDVIAKMADKAIVIEGHTDNVPIRGGLGQLFPSNWELSTARAASVVRFLEETVGIEPRRLAAMGYGEHRPVVPNDSPEGKARNRRIEIKLIDANVFESPEDEADLSPEPETSENPEGPEPETKEAGVEAQ